MVELIKRNNYIDGSFIDVDDFKTEQNYFIEKIRAITNKTAGNGSLEIRGLEIEQDSVMSEPIGLSRALIPIERSPDITAPNPQNYTSFPDALDTSLTSLNLYTIFKATTGNLQKISLRLTLDQPLDGESLDLLVRVRTLVDPSNPQSTLSSTPPLFESEFAENEIPLLDSDELLSIDLSGESSGQGLSLKKGNHYAITLEFRRSIGSTKNIRIFHGPINENSQLDNRYFSWIFSESRYRQNYLDSFGLQQQIMIYHLLETSAVKIGAGEAIINGQKTIVEKDQFTKLEIPDRRNVDQFGSTVYNYAILRYKEEFTDPELIQGTRNTANTRIKDASVVEILTQPQWDQLLTSTDSNYLLLALINDSNIQSIYKKHTFTVPTNSTKLAFHDWLNPNNLTPTTEANLLRSSRPNDFIFFLSNVPSKVPLTDNFGTVQLEPTTVRDEFGNIIKRAGDPVLDEIVRVSVSLTLANGSNTRTFELSLVSEQGTSSIKYRNFAATISSLFDNPFDEVFTYNFNEDQIAPNVVYNFVAFTKRGLPVFIQDYNRVITKDQTTEILRDQQFSVFGEQDAKTLVIPQDLKLGNFKPLTDGSQPGVVQYVPSLIRSEQLIPVGSAEVEIVTFNDEVLLEAYQSFLFDAPMVSSLSTRIPNKDSELQLNYDSGAVTVLVDAYDGLGAVDITFSGPDNRDRGGDGAPVLLIGTLASTLSLPVSANLEVKARRANGKDCTNYDPTLTPFGPALVAGPTNIRAFNLLVRGKDELVSGNSAGFSEGEPIYLWIGDRQALDQNYQPITLNFDSGDSNVLLPTIYHLGDQRYFREKQILSTENSTTATPGTVLIDTGLDNSGEPRTYGQVIFNFAEIPTSIVENAKVYLNYNSVSIVPQNIDYYKTNFPIHGTKDGFKIENTNTTSSTSEYISVPEAFALSSSINNNLAITDSNFSTIALFVDGINITSTLSPIGQKTIVADNGITLLPSQVAYNPTLGTFKFYKTTDGYGTIVSEAPSDFTRLSASYYKLDLRYTFNSANDLVYQPKFDLNNDGKIDELDLQILNRSLGSIQGDPNYLVAADFNLDGKIDQEDLDLFRESFGAVALGVPDYSDATTARLGSLLVLRKGNYLEQIKVVRVVCKPADNQAPNGLTVFFLDETTPIKEAGDFDVRFGFKSALYQGFNQIEIETARPLQGTLNLENIKMFEAENPLNKKKIIGIESSSLQNSNGFYPSLLTFTSSVDRTSNYIVRTSWSKEGLLIKSALDPILPQRYKEYQKLYGSFRLDYENQDFSLDGTKINCKLRASDASFADGSVDRSGRFINGIPLSEFTFTIHLTLKNANGSQSLWTWHQVRPSGVDNKIVLEFNNSLFVDHRNRGKEGASVLTPFGLGVDQVRLMPKFAGGDLENDLRNLSVLRSDIISDYVKPHTHRNERDGGLLDSRSIRFQDDLARLNLDTASDLTDAIYKLLDLVKDQERELALLKAAEGVVRYDRGLKWDAPDLYWDS